MKLIGLFLLPHGLDISPWQGYPNIKFSITHLYTWVESATTSFPGSLIFVPHGERERRDPD